METSSSLSRSTESNKRRDTEDGLPSGNVKNSSTNTNSKTNQRRSRGRRRTQAQIRFQRDQDQDKALDPIHLNDFGDELGPKPEGRMRIGGGNADNFRVVNFNNEKANLCRAWARTYDLDGMFCQEGGLNWKLMPRSGRLEQIMKTDSAMRTVTAHNEHEEIGRRQWGGTWAVAYGELATRVSDMEKDETGLGRWAWMKFEGREGHVLRIIMAYNPNYTSNSNNGKVYSQHKRYLEQHHDQRTPTEAFREDLEKALRKWRSAGEKLILFIDMNENYETGAIE